MFFNSDNSFGSRIRETLIPSQRIGSPPARWIIPAMGAVIALFVTLALIAVPPGRSPEYHFVEESGAVTAFSAILLAMACSLAGACVFFSRDRQRWHIGFWFVTTMALGFFAFDELLGFHELVGRRLDRMPAWNHGLVEKFRAWNDIVVIGYGLVGLLAAACFLPVVVQYRGLPALLGTAFFFFAVHTAIDSTCEPPTVVSIVCEETSKLLCSACLAFFTFQGLTCIIDERERRYGNSNMPEPNCSGACR